MLDASIPNTYNGSFARAFDLNFSHYAREAGLRILDFFSIHPAARPDARVLDLGCGTGQLALLFLQTGWAVVGIDKSEDMLALARKNCAAYAAGQQAFFHRADIRNFKIQAPIALATSTYNTLNHLESEADLAACIRRVYDHLLKPGLFLFDLNTRKGLKVWDGVERQNTGKISYVSKGMYDESSGKAVMRMEGSFLRPDGRSEPFAHTTVNQAFELRRVEAMLKASGFTGSHFALIEDLGTPLADPEKALRVFTVAEKI